MGVGRSGVAAVFESTQNPGFDLNSRLGQAVRTAHNFQIERDVARRKPRPGIQKLHLDRGGRARLARGRGRLRRKSARAKLLDHAAVLLLNALAQGVFRELGGSGEFFVA